MSAERRQFERIRIRAQARVVSGRIEARFQTRDLSLGGAFLVGCESDEPLGDCLSRGVRVEISLLPDEDAPYHAEDGGQTFRATARIVRSDEHGVGLQFEDIDVENHARLHALVEVDD
jgi:c-di-GMP-binding flagellar brake protein YcgR